MVCSNHNHEQQTDYIQVELDPLEMAIISDCLRAGEELFERFADEVMKKVATDTIKRLRQKLTMKIVKKVIELNKKVI